MRFLASLFALTFLTLAGCPSREPPLCPPDGTGFANGTGLYCAYGVVIGGFRECPMGLPNRFDFPDGSFVCSDQPIGSRDAIPDDVCARLTACAGADAGTLDVGSVSSGDAPWPNITSPGICPYFDYGSTCRVPCSAPPDARFSVRVQWDSAYCCTFFGPFETFEGCRCTDGFVECPWREAGGIWDNPRSTCEFCPGTPSGPRDAGSAGPG